MLRHLTFGGRYIFYQQDFSCDERREKSHRRLYQENRVDFPENSHQVLSKMMSKMMSYFRSYGFLKGLSCDKQKFHRYPSSINIFGRILQTL